MMHRLHRLMRRAAVLSGLIALLPFMAVSVTAAPQHQTSDPVTLRIAMTAPDNLDPTQLSRFDPHTHDLVENLFVGLTRFDPTTQTIEPMLAKSWTISDDELTWTFELRDDIYWVQYNNETQQTDAVRPVAAGDMVYAIQRACDPLRPSPVTANLMAIKGCHTVSNAFPEVINDLFIAREIGARATSPTTLEIDLLFPISYFPTLLSTPELRPLPRETLSAPQEINRSTQLMTSGPFVLNAWTDTGMSLERNTQWPDSLTGNVERIKITFTGDATDPFTLASSNQIDAARLASDHIAAAQASLPDRLAVTPGGTMIAIGYSFERAVVESAAARRALSLAIDRETLATTVFGGNFLAAKQFAPPGIVAEPHPGYEFYDVTQARASFEQAGFQECNNMPEPLILLVPDDNPLWEDLGTAIIQQWVTTLGCNPALFEVKAVPRTLLIELSHANYDPEQVTRSHMWLFTWNADYPDAHAWTNDVLHCRYGYVRNGRECDQADEALDRASRTYDENERAGYYTEAEDAFFGVNGSYSIAPLFVESSAWLQQPWLSMLNTNGAARYDLWIIDPTNQPGT